MESLVAFPDGDRDSFNRLFFNEELDFTQQILHQFSSPMEHDDEGLSFINPSTFWPNSEANMSSNAVVNESNLLYSSNALSNFHYNVPPLNHETYYLNGSHHITDSSPLAFPNIAMEDGRSVNVIEDLSTDCLGKPDAATHQAAANLVLVNGLLLKRKIDQVLELHAEGAKISNSNSPENTRKRPRASKDAPKVYKNVQYSKKSRKEGESNIIGSDGQSSSTTCSSEDDNVSQDTNGVANSDSKASSQALNLNAKTRASRGAATDPQSLYARKRRERINERLRILQNLVPNGTKVDISTMLEDAVHYVKFLQLQIKLLSSDDLWMYAPIAYNGFDIGLNKISALL
ncbi:hypothetical protein PTKIN_Ptkin01aG0062800 [Pterospermum kingtungense]